MYIYMLTFRSRFRTSFGLSCRISAKAATRGLTTRAAGWSTIGLEARGDSQRKDILPLPPGTVREKGWG